MVIFTMITKLYIVYAYVDVICVCVSLLLKKKNLATPCGMWDLSSPPVIEPTPPALEA